MSRHTPNPLHRVRRRPAHRVRRTRARWRVQAKDAVDRGGQVLLFDDDHQPADRAGFPRDAGRRRRGDWRQPADGPAAPAEPARPAPRGPGPAEARRGRPRDHAAAAALGLAQQPARRRLGRVAQAGRSGAARERGQGPHPAYRRRRLPLHGRDGGQPAGLRGGDAAPCSPATANASIGRSPPGRWTFATTHAGSPPSRCSGRAGLTHCATSTSSNRDRR